MGNIVGGQTEPAQVAIATCIAARLAASDSGAAAGRRDNSAIPISYLIVNEVVSNQIKVQIIIRNYFKQVGGLQNFAVFRNQQVHINVSLNEGYAELENLVVETYSNCKTPTYFNKVSNVFKA